MLKIALKVITFTLLLTCLVILIVHLRSGDVYKKITVVEKYYGHQTKDTAIGMMNHKKIHTPSDKKGNACAIETNTNNIYAIDCNLFVLLHIKDKRSILLKQNKIVAIRRK